MKANEEAKTVDIDMLSLMLKQRIAVMKIQSGFLDIADHVANNLRNDDYREVHRSSGKCPRTVVNNAWKMSCMKWIIFFERESVALFGVVRDANNLGIPWMVATDKFHNRDMEIYFARNCEKYINEFFVRGEFPLLYNCVDVENSSSIRWLEWCGFTMDEIIKHGPFNLPFYKFSMPRYIH